MSWDGLILINKPQGEISHSVVQTIKNRLEVTKAGHLGTLDPLATGVFPVCLGKATRLAPFYMGADKCYQATLRFGFFTSTDDREGKPEGPPARIQFSKQDLERTVASLCGEFTQTPPAFSAKKLKGQKAYQLARKGIKPRLPSQKVTIYEMQVLQFGKKDLADIFIHCSSGTYVRSIAREIGMQLSCGAHVTELTRTKFNDFTIEQSCSPDASLETLRASFIPLEKVLSQYPEVTLSSELCKKIWNGSAVEVEQPFGRDWVRIFNPEKTLLALARVDTQDEINRILPKIVFH